MRSTRNRAQKIYSRGLNRTAPLHRSDRTHARSQAMAAMVFKPSISQGQAPGPGSG